VEFGAGAPPAVTLDLAGLEQVLTRIVADGGAGAPARIGEACVAALSLTRGAIAMMAARDQQEPLWASDAVARELDEMQFGLGEGPCIEGFVERRPVLVDDVRAVHAQRWPVFAAAARRTPVRAMFVLPLQTGAITVGVLSLYRDEPGGLEPDELAGALRAADAALWAMLGLRDGEKAGGTTDISQTRADPHGWLAGSPLHRTEVYQATGMVIEQLQVSAETALSALRARAFALDRSILDVARDVVGRRLRLDEERR
jgi:hypothetical protein